MKRTMIVLFLGLAALLWGETVINGSRSILGAWNAGGAASTIPAKVGTSAPATCTVGEQFFKSDATAGSNILLCTATNTWTAVTGGDGGGGAAECLPGDLRYFCLHEEFMSGTGSTGTAGALGWILASSTGSTTYPSVTWPRPGVIQLATNTTSANVNWIRLGTSSTLGNIAAGSNVLQESKWVFRLTDATDVDLRVGWGSYGAGGILSTGFALGSTGGEFAIAGKTAFSTETLHSLGIVLDTNWHTIRFYTDGATASKVFLSFDGGEAVTICASGCTINSTYAHIFGTNDYTPLALVKTNTTAAKNLQLDYFGYKATVGTTEHVR